jgi:hypothetical protein
MLLSGMHVDLPDASLRPRPWRGDRVSGGGRAIPEETALALTYNGGTYALMMGTPYDLEDFAIGFSLNAGIVESADAIESLELVRVENGIELRMWLARVKAARLSERRRHIAGPTGCGLCGIDSIAEAVGPAAIVGPGPTSHPIRSWQRCEALRRCRRSTSKRMRFTPGRPGHRKTASWHCARTWAATMSQCSGQARRCADPR